MLWIYPPEIVDGKLHKVISTSHTHKDHKPVTAEITVLYRTWLHAKPIQRSTTFHIVLEGDGNYHYHWTSQHHNAENKLVLSEHDFIIKPGFVLGTWKPEKDGKETR